MSFFPQFRTVPILNGRPRHSRSSRHLSCNRGRWLATRLHPSERIESGHPLPRPAKAPAVVQARTASHRRVPSLGAVRFTSIRSRARTGQRWPRSSLQARNATTQTIVGAPFSCCFCFLLLLLVFTRGFFPNIFFLAPGPKECRPPTKNGKTNKERIDPSLSLLCMQISPLHLIFPTAVVVCFVLSCLLFSRPRPSDPPRASQAPKMCVKAGRPRPQKIEKGERIHPPPALGSLARFCTGRLFCHHFLGPSRRTPPPVFCCAYFFHSLLRSSLPLSFLNICKKNRQKPNRQPQTKMG